MKICLLLSILSCFRFAVTKAAKIENFYAPLLYEISKYLDKPYESIGNLNKNMKKTFHEGRVSLLLISEYLNMPDVALIETKDYEGVNELLGIVAMKIAPKIVFMVLYKTVIDRKICPVLQMYMVKYLRDIYGNIGPIEIEFFDNDFDTNCAKILAAQEEFKLLLEWYGDDTKMHSIFNTKIHLIIDNISSLSHEKKRHAYSAIFKQNILKTSYKMFLRTRHSNYLELLLADAVIYDAPESWFTSLLTMENLIILFGYHFGEHEMHILYQKMTKIIDELQDCNIKRLARILNEVRFGSVVDVNDTFNVLISSKIPAIALLKISFFRKKEELFKLLVIHYSNSYIPSALRIFASSNEVFYINIHFEILEILNLKQQVENFNSSIVRFLKKFCFITELKQIGKAKLFQVTFKSKSDLSRQGFPDQVTLILNPEESVCSHFISEFWGDLETETPEKLKEIFTNFFQLRKVKKYIRGIKAAKCENSFTPFIYFEIITNQDFLEGYEYGKDFTRIIPSYETAYMILKDDYMKSILRDNGIRVVFSADVVLKLIENPIDNVVLNIQENVLVDVMKCAKTRIELIRLEKLSGKTIAEILLSQELLSHEEFYYEYRHCFIYWINSPYKHRIAELSSDIIKDFLKLEYPEFMKEILK